MSKLTYIESLEENLRDKIRLEILGLNMMDLMRFWHLTEFFMVHLRRSDEKI